jgi:hypothetical protein
VVPDSPVVDGLRDDGGAAWRAVAAMIYRNDQLLASFQVQVEMLKALYQLRLSTGTMRPSDGCNKHHLQVSNLQAVFVKLIQRSFTSHLKRPHRSIPARGGCRR